ncbi:fungal-specific transcription factor domain-containing protein [Xylaria sp. CBS 124048]|nr:fungal-specific transcription factor domain-containing protein [Xylaria sp. CBS 124048]
MTRPKVDPDKRQRTAQACDSCKRRKQKCNGQTPCSTCTKRGLVCQYTPTALDHSGLQDGFGPAAKRRHLNSSPNMLKSSIEIEQSTARRNSALMPWAQPTEAGELDLDRPVVIKTPQHRQIGMSRPFLTGTDGDFDSRSKFSNASAAADEAEVYPQNRMLQDSTGRLLYIGDSASLSYLQWIRMIVENTSGPSDFTTDPRRHMIMENTISLPQDLRPTGILPDQRTANILINSFFTNTAGFIEVFNKQAFLKSVDECYKDPLGVTPSLLCLLYLVFAIGLVMAAPFPGSDESAVIEKLRSERSNQAELFFRSAKSLADPVSGFEDADFWSIQALLLMSLYMLAVSKRNASYAYYGMAVRSAFALGLHREESMEVFPHEECSVRKRLWRTLFILDRFLSACLGRPTAISEEDCSDIEFKTTPCSSPMDGRPESTHLAALEAAVKSCQVIGMTLKRVYSKRKISTIVGQEIAASLETWNKELPASLHWRRLISRNIDSTEGMAILHINLLHCHSVMLLTRPFFLCLLNKSAVGLVGSNSKPSRLSHKMENFAQTCVEASQHTLVLTQAVLDEKYLPQCDPFIIHCVFAAALIVLSNEFASLYHNPDARTSIDSAISILRFCSQNDKQAERVSYIVENFDRANEQRSLAAKRLYLPGRKTPIMPTLSQNSSFDAMGHFFRVGHREAFYAATTSAFDDESILAATTLPSMPQMIPSIIQEPSPEGSVSMSSGMTTTAGMAPGIDTMGGGDSEFDLDSLWDCWHNAANIPAATVQHPNSFGGYSLGNSQIHPGGPSVMYHPSAFK